MTLNEFIVEARRRNVFRAAGLYAGFAFVVLQLADILLPEFGMGQGAVSTLLLLIATGFPLVLVISWFVEITSEGIEITPSIESEQRQKLQPGRMVDLAIIVLALGVGYMYLERFGDPGPTSPAQGNLETVDPTSPLITVPLQNSIAVLPFENLSASEENAFFAAGIHEDVLNSLSQNPELIVTSRTSTLAYEGSRKAISEIAAELDVAYVMEGSVRRAGDRVRISVQLIEAKTDHHVWSEAYERTLTDIFAIQVEVAQNVANALEVQFGGGPQVTSEAIPLAAYDMFIEARSLASTYEPQNLARAIQLYEQAIALDRNYVDAWAGLSLSLTSLRFAGGATQESNQRAVDTATQSLALDPENWLANYAMARHLGSDDVARFADSNRYFEKVIEKNPNGADPLVFYGFSLTWQGRSADGASYFGKAYRRDPLSAEANLARAMALGWQGDLKGSRAHADRALRFAPKRPYISWWVGALNQFVLFDQFEAARHLLNAYRENPRFVQASLWLSGVAAHLGDYETTEAWLSRAREIDPNHTGVMFRTGDNLLVTEQYEKYRHHIAAWVEQDATNMIGQVYASAVHGSLASEAYDREDMATFQSESQAALDDALTYIRDSNEAGQSEVQFWNSWMFMSAGLYAGLLKDDDLKTRLFRQLADYQNQQVNPTEIQAAISYAALGEHDKAIEQLNGHLAQGFSQTRHLKMYGLLDDDYGVYGNIKNNVGFMDVVSRMEARNTQVLERLRGELPEFFPNEDPKPRT